MKKYAALFLVVLMAVSIVGAAGVVTAAPIAKPIATPNLVAPKNNINLYGQPLTVLLQWKPVNDQRLKEYEVELQIYEPAIGQWVKLNPAWLTPTTNTFYQIDLPAGAYEYRWRVTALSNVAGFDSAPSSWRSFSFENPDTVKLATPHILSPANNIKVGVGMPITYNWDPVPGAFEYVFSQEKLVDGVWVRDNPVTVLSDQSLPFTSTRYTDTAGTFRWHVVALASDYATFSEPSAWRTLTVE